MTDITVVIPAYNEAATIAKCLQSLHIQTRNDFEVIVVDNASTDRTQQAAKMASGNLHLRIVTEKQKGRGVARALGFQQAKGKYILSTDADGYVPQMWVESLVRCLKDPKYIAVSGTAKITDCQSFANACFNIGQPWMMRVHRLRFQHVYLCGFNFGIIKKAYFAAGGFNPNLLEQEDVDLGFRVHRLGKIKFFPNLPVTVSGRRFKRNFLQGALIYVASFEAYRKGENPGLLYDIRN
ncbi:glycosyltransferase [Candidatus Microgenomates bacterium]|nr:MAG: glycosyltransferase [Candidatus Microgenomates bacterium]